VPELPEVEVVRAGLERHVVGATITRVDVLHPRPVRRDVRGPLGFVEVLTGRRIEAARRRGKYLWLPLDNGDALLGHLGMSGQILVQPPDAPDERHLRIRFALDGADEGRPFDTARPSPTQDKPFDTARPSPTQDKPFDTARPSPTQDMEMRFVDQRMFGGLSVSAGGAELPPEIAHIARDPLDPEFDDDAFVHKVRKRSSGVKRQLLDQNLVSGVGNIYADEALWRAQIHGDRPGERLTATQVRELLRHAREVMVAALGEGGTSFDALYVNVNGESGYFDRALHAYGREGEPCERCGAPIRRIAFMNRSSYFCPVCQPAPRKRRATPTGFRDGSLGPSHAPD
jgi:formamidopyrimidine-DNA glycosylase